MCFEDWTDAEDMALILGITEEIEEECRSHQISNYRLTPEEKHQAEN